MADSCELLRVNVERGPNWLFLRIHPTKRDRYTTLADQLWSVLTCHFTYRVVIELHEFKQLSATMLEQLVELRSRIVDRGGKLRLCGCSASVERVLESAGLTESLPAHSDRESAVAGFESSHDLKAPHFDAEVDQFASSVSRRR